VQQKNGSMVAQMHGLALIPIKENVPIGRSDDYATESQPPRKPARFSPATT
jgi:hypothetical protein